MNIFQNFGCGRYTDSLANFAPHWGISAVADQARFLGQISVESQNFTKIIENLNYKPQRLLDVFKGRNGLATLDQATAICAKGPTGIAAAIYGGAWGLQHLGNRNDEDAFNFIGHGLIMITGYSNTRDASYGCYGDDRLLRNPGLLTTPDGAANVACWYWYNRKLSALTDITAITRIINGGLNGLQDRIDATNRALALCASE